MKVNFEWTQNVDAPIQKIILYLLSWRYGDSAVERRQNFQKGLDFLRHGCTCLQNLQLAYYIDIL